MFVRTNVQDVPEVWNVKKSRVLYANHMSEDARVEAINNLEARGYWAIDMGAPGMRDVVIFNGVVMPWRHVLQREKLHGRNISSDNPGNGVPDQHTYALIQVRPYLRR